LNINRFSNNLQILQIIIMKNTNPHSKMSKSAPLAFSASAIMLLAGTSKLEASIIFDLVTDNDFTVLAGTSSSVTRVLYQNDLQWNLGQIGNPVSLDLVAGEDTFYVLAMGGGGDENISGTINGINMTQIPGVQESSAFSAMLSGYNLSDVANGSYTPSLVDIQAAYPGLTWTAPTVTSSGVVINLNPSAFIPGDGYKGFDVPRSNAVMFSFDAQDIGAIPEPSSTLTVCSLLAAGLMLRTRRV